MTYTLFAAMSMDGYIAHHNREFTDWTSPQDKEHLHQHLDATDIVLVGNNTYKTAIAPLSKRPCIVLTRQVQEMQSISDHSVYCNPQSVDISEYCSAHNYRNIAVLGGTETYNYCLEYNMIHEVFITIEPLVFGRGLTLFNTQAEYCKKMRLVQSSILNKEGSILLHYKIYG